MSLPEIRDYDTFAAMADYRGVGRMNKGIEWLKEEVNKAQQATRNKGAIKNGN